MSRNNEERLSVIINESLVDAIAYNLDFGKEHAKRIIEDVEWLIEQAEELSDFRKIREILDIAHRANLQYKENENERLREALKLILTPEAYEEYESVGVDSLKSQWRWIPNEH